MKKLINFVAVLLVAGLMAACSCHNEATTEETIVEEQVDTAEVAVDSLMVEEVAE